MVDAFVKQVPGNATGEIRTDGGHAEEFERALVLGAFVLFGALYYATCAPGVLWQDSAMFQHRVFFFDLRGESGLPLAHPLYILLAKALTLAMPFDDFAGRVNLFSALCGAATMAFSMRLLLNLTRRPVAAVVGTIALGVSHTFWTHCAIAEVYSLYSLGLFAELWCVERFVSTRQAKWYIAAVAICGLNLSNHLLAILHGPGYVILMLWGVKSRVFRPSHVVLAIVAFIAGTLPYSWLIGQDIAAGNGVLATLKESLVGPPERANKVLDTHFSIGRELIRTVQYFGLNFPTPAAILAAFGLKRLFSSAATATFGIFLLCVGLVDLVFAFRYPVPDQFVFFTPCYAVVAVCIGLGADWILKTLQPRRGAWVSAALVAVALMPAGVYAVAPSLMKRFNFNIGSRRDIPFRDTIRYFVQPWKCGDHGAARFAEAAFPRAAPDGLLYADTTIKNVLVYVRDVEERWPNVMLTTGHDTIPRPPVIDRTPEAVEPFVKSGKAFICSDAHDYVPKWITDRWRLEPSGIIFKIVEADRPISR